MAMPGVPCIALHTEKNKHADRRVSAYVKFRSPAEATRCLEELTSRNTLILYDSAECRLSRPTKYQAPPGGDVGTNPE